jgi:hypothetical protein
VHIIETAGVSDGMTKQSHTWSCAWQLSIREWASQRMCVCECECGGGCGVDVLCLWVASA